LAVIRTIAERSPDTLGVSTLARELTMSKAVTHRILKELVADGFLTFDDETKRYRLGPGALTVGLAALRALDVPGVARPHMITLAERSGESVTLSARQGWSRVYIDQVLSVHEIRMSVALGTQHPLHAGASSKAILAALTDQDIDEYLAHAEFRELTVATPTSPAQLRAEVGLIRAQGYAVSHGERQTGAGSVAAPIRTAGSDVFGSLSLCGPQDRFTPEACRRYGALVAAAARELSAEIGAPAESLFPQGD